MRLWSLHPQYLDSRGLVALWREALLAQAVVSGTSAGYRHHPQLHRFLAHPDPAAAIARYLRGVLEEAVRRGYRFDASRIRQAVATEPMHVTSDQLRFEWEHLLAKLRTRAPALADRHSLVDEPLAHSLFQVVPGPIAPWERVA